METLKPEKVNLCVRLFPANLQNIFLFNFEPYN